MTSAKELVGGLDEARKTTMDQESSAEEGALAARGVSQRRANSEESEPVGGRERMARMAHGSVVRFRGFYGSHRHALDTKGRIAVPVKFRDGLGQTFMLTKGNDECLVGYPMDEWEAIAERLDLIPETDREGREFARHVFGGAQDCEIDKQGRIVIGDELREYAGLTKETCFVGMRRRFEIWDETKRAKAMSKYDGRADVLAEKMQKYLYGDRQAF